MPHPRNMDRIVKDPVNVGIIGAGIMGRRLLDAARESTAGPNPAVRVTGVWDPAPAALADLPGIPVLPSAEAVIAAADCVYIASPPATHLPHARAALAAGRAVFCEKPLAVDVHEARRLLVDPAAARMAVNFPFASSLPVARLRAWIDEGAIGTPRSASIAVAFARWPRGWQHAAASWLDGPAQGGFVREVVSHFLFLAHRLFGPLAVGQAEASFPEAGRSERRVTARLTAGTVPVSLDGAVGTTQADDSNLFTVEGTGGSVRLRDWATAERLVDGAWQPDPGAIPHAQARPLTLIRQLEGVAGLVRNEPHHLATAAEAFAVQDAVEAILRG